MGVLRLFGDVLNEQGTDIEFDALAKIIKRPYIKPRFRVSVLNPDETVRYTIPNEDIPEDGISYTEEYQNGQRRNITLQLINRDGKYTPSINGIWISTKFRFDIGIETKDDVIWFPRGVYIMGDISLIYEDSNRTISFQLKDKYAIFEGKMGTLEEAYEVELGSTIEDALNGIMNFAMGNGYIMDSKPIILDPSFVGFKTQSTIRVEEGGNLGEVINALATQLSAEFYYNNIGNLCFYPINETIDDSNKPVIWVFEKLNRGIHSASLNYATEQVINVVKVVGDNVDKGIYSAVVTNENPASPICIQQVGRRIAPKYSEANVWSDDLAESLARYYLRQSSFIAVDFSCNVSFNPILTCNNIVEVENDFLNLQREKLLITSISYSSRDGLMSVKMCNTKELPLNVGGLNN